jgi:hypothetical protein
MAAASLMANDAELQSLKNQMEQMSQMMKSMQNKIDTLENSKPQSVKAPEATSVMTESTTTALMPALIKDFMPTSGIANNSNLALSLIVDTSFVVRSKKDEELAHMGLPGVAHSLIGSHDHDGHNHATYDAQNGFNLNYAELGFTGTVDPYLDASVFLHFYDGGVEVEEAYFTSRNLPYNLRLRGGKFFSDFGRQNNQHHHAWQFSDMPLVYEAFLGNHGIQEIGAQLQWIAPTSNYLMFGLEALQGKNEMMFGHEAIANPNVADENLAGSASQPSLFVGYVKTSADIGDTTILAGASIAKGESRINHLDDEENPHAFSGDSTTLYGLDLTVKHFFDSYSSLTWQSEWLYRDMDGTQFRNVDTDADDIPDTINSGALTKKQAGYYTQLVYAPDQSWRMGLKYDNIYKNDISNPNTFTPKNMDQYTAMVEYHSSEFARYRLQYSHSNALFNEDDQRQNLDSLIFSVNIALGRHNAHPF